MSDDCQNALSMSDCCKRLSACEMQMMTEAGCVLCRTVRRSGRPSYGALAMHLPRLGPGWLSLPTRTQ